MTIAPNERSSWCRYPPASTTPSSNRNCTARWLPQAPAVPAPSRRELRRVAADNAHGNLLQIAPAPPVPGIVTAVEVGASITFIKYRPQSKPSASCPLAPSVTCGDSSLPEGAIFRQLLRFHIGFLRIGSASCESLSHGEGHRGLPGRASALSQGSLWTGALQKGLDKKTVFR